MAVGAAAFAAARTARGAGGSLGQRPNVPEAEIKKIVQHGKDYICQCNLLPHILC